MTILVEVEKISFINDNLGSLSSPCPPNVTPNPTP